MRRWWTFLCLGIMFLFLTLASGPAAYADDSNNSVNPQQMPDSSFIYDTSIADLGGANTYYDDQTVQVVGEVVGDSILAGVDGQYRWITLASIEEGSMDTISVYMTKEAADKIDTFGAYGKTGTILQVRGTFNLVCPEHEGLTDLHAESVSVVDKGKQHEDEFSVDSLIPGVVVITIGLTMMGAFYYLRERQR